MAYPMNPPDPTDVVGRRIVAFIIDLLLVLVLSTAIMVPIVWSSMETAPDTAVTCNSSGGSTSFENPGTVNNDPGLCFSTGDGEVRYLPVSKENGMSFSYYGVALAVGFLNSVLLQSVKGASLGKLALGLRVIRQDGRRANIGWNLLRWILLLAGTLFCCIGWIVDLVMVFATKGHRRVGDFAGGTFVVGKDDDGKAPQILGVTMMAPTGYPQPGPQGNPAPGYAPQQSWTPPPTGPAPTASTPQPAPVDPTTPVADGPTWDEARDAYIQYDPELAEWVQWDTQQNRWRSIDQ